MKLIPYLNFPGNCEEALNFYQKVFNGSITDLSRFGDTFPVPDDQKQRIMHVKLHFDDNTLMFSDGMPGGTVVHGNGINLSLGLTDETKARLVFKALADGGQVTREMEKQFWGAIFGQVTDRFDVQWMINCDL